MTKNMGKIDRGARLVVAAILIFLAFGTDALGSAVMVWLALIVSGLFVVTSLVGNCPLYGLLGIKTCRDC